MVIGNGDDVNTPPIKPMVLLGWFIRAVADALSPRLRCENRGTAARQWRDGKRAATNARSVTRIDMDEGFSIRHVLFT